MGETNIGILSGAIYITVVDRGRLFVVERERERKKERKKEKKKKRRIEIVICQPVTEHNK